LEVAVEFIFMSEVIELSGVEVVKRGGEERRKDENKN
jgi:hypothetical protein